MKLRNSGGVTLYTITVNNGNLYSTNCSTVDMAVDEEFDCWVTNTAFQEDFDAGKLSNVEVTVAASTFAGRTPAVLGGSHSKKVEVPLNDTAGMNVDATVSPTGIASAGTLNEGEPWLEST